MRTVARNRPVRALPRRYIRPVATIAEELEPCLRHVAHVYVISAEMGVRQASHRDQVENTIALARESLEASGISILQTGSQEGPGGTQIGFCRYQTVEGRERQINAKPVSRYLPDGEPDDLFHEKAVLSALNALVQRQAVESPEFAASHPAISGKSLWARTQRAQIADSMSV